MIELGALLAGKYRVLAKLGEGGMGSVYRAENQLTGKQVALKCLHAHLGGHADASERLLREARAASSLSHPNVVDVYDVVRDGETLFLVMELLRGSTLRGYLAAHPQPKISELIALLLPAIDGVATAHERGVIHRDLKPDNIFIAEVPGAPGGVIKVLDFGIAKLAMANGPTLTQTGVALGTPLYMSLEQLRGDKDVDQRADVYAFGAMLYEAVTGSMPYQAETLPELAIKVATSDPAPVKSLRPDVPTPLARLIDWAVARDRSQRMPDLRTMQRELDAFARDHSFREQMTRRDAPLPRLAAAGEPPLPAAMDKTAVAAPRSEPDTLRARELVSVARRRSPGSRGALLGAAAIVSLGLAAGVWRLSSARETPEAPPPTAAAVSGAPGLAQPELQGPSPLAAPGAAAELRPQSDPEARREPTAAEAAPPPAPTPAREAPPTPERRPAASRQLKAAAKVDPTPASLTPAARVTSTPVAVPVPVGAPPKRKSSLDLVGF